MKPLSPDNLPHGLRAREHAEYVQLDAARARHLQQREEMRCRVAALVIGAIFGLAVCGGAVALAALFGAFE